MAKDWVTLAAQDQKVKDVFIKLTPPVPDDDFESMRADVLRLWGKLHTYVSEKATSE